MNRKPIMALLALAICLIIFAPTTATALDLAGWTKTEGSNFDLYLTPDSQVQNVEIAQVINYGVKDLILKVQSDSKTYYSQIIEPHKSAIIELPFDDVETTYKVTISSDGLVLYTVTKTRPTFLLPRPIDDGYQIYKPPVANTNKYNDVDLAAALASITLEVLVLTTLIVALGALLGATIKQIVKFFTPIDLLSIFFYLFLILDTLFKIIGEFDRIWYIPLFVGYQVGFFIWHLPYFMPIKIDSQNKSMDIRPKAVYFPGDSAKPCIQDQNNKALIQRALGIHHELSHDGVIDYQGKNNKKFAPDWFFSIKKPYFPSLKGSAYWVQRTETDIEEIPGFFGLITWKKLKTHNTLANASRMPYYLWLMGSKSMHDLTSRLEWSENTRIHDRMTTQANATASAADMIEHSVTVSTHQATREIFSRPIGEPQKIDLGEHTLNDMTAAHIEESSFADDDLEQDDAKESNPDQEKEKPDSNQSREPESRQQKAEKRQSKPVKKKSKGKGERNQ